MSHELRYITPAITQPQDGYFLERVGSFVGGELDDAVDEEGRFLVFQTALEMLIDHLPVYRPLLTGLAHEYKVAISDERDSVSTTMALESKLRELMSRPATLQNLEMRIEQVLEKTRKAESEKAQLLSSLEALQREKVELENRPDTPPLSPPSSPRMFHHLPGLTEDDGYQEEKLIEKLQQLQEEIETLERSKDVECVSLAAADAARGHLNERLAERDVAAERCARLFIQQQRLKCAHTAAKQSREGNAAEIARTALKELRPHAAVNFLSLMTTLSINHHQQPNIRDMLKQFDTLCSARQYTDAAELAASVPSLATAASLCRLMSVSPSGAWRLASLLLASDASRPSPALAKLCFEVALLQRRIPWIAHWLAKNKLAPSRELGDILMEAEDTLDLAEVVYRRLEDWGRLAECLELQRKVRQATQAKGSR